MSSIILNRFKEATQRFAKAQEAVLTHWNQGCNCEKPGEEIKCSNCAYYKNLGRLTQKYLNHTLQADFALILPPVLEDIYGEEAKQLCLEMYQRGYSFHEIKHLVGIPQARILRKWLREVGLPNRSASYADDVQQKSLELYAQGYAPAQIEKETGVPSDTIVDWAYQTGICHHSKYSSELKARCIERYQAGENSNDLHLETGIPLATIQSWIRKAGVYRPQKRYSSEEKNHCFELYVAGKEVTEIEAQTGIKSGTIRSWLRKYGQTKPEQVANLQTEIETFNQHYPQKPKKPRHPNKYLSNFENLADEIRMFNAQRGVLDRIPTADQLRTAGRGDLQKAISKHHGGFQSVAQRMGLEYNKKTHGYWYDFKNVKKEVFDYIEKNGKSGIMPTKEELTKAGKNALVFAITNTHGGFVEVAQKLELELSYHRKPRGYWKNLDNLRLELTAVCEQLQLSKTMPTYDQLQELERTDLIAAISTNGGWPGVAKKLGWLNNQQKCP